MYTLLADIVIVLHAMYVVFVVAGQVMILTGWYYKWHWTTSPLFRVIHITAILFVVAEVWFGIVCPLTTLEYELRIRAGQTTNEMSFIGYWLNRLLFFSASEWIFTLAYTLFALSVITVFVYYPPKWKS
jgi:hypothetical protein